MSRFDTLEAEIRAYRMEATVRDFARRFKASIFRTPYRPEHPDCPVLVWSITQAMGRALAEVVAETAEGDERAMVIRGLPTWFASGVRPR